MPRDKPDKSRKLPRLVSWKWLLAVWLVFLVLDFAVGSVSKGRVIAYSEFKAQLRADNVAAVSIGERTIRGTHRAEVNGKLGFTTVPVADDELLPQLEAKKVEIKGIAPSSGWGSWIVWLFPALLFVGLFYMLRRGGGAGGMGMLTVGRSKAKLYMEDEMKVSFDDVAGVDEAKEELTEVVKFLSTPEHFQRLGGKLPKGILLVGPPGTGKTLLARAVAGEAKVPFYSISGSAFVEMFVGVGAARVRDLFAEAGKHSPCIIFIDELDALGKARTMGPMNHEEREQTLNQLLVELDGFDPQIGVVLMAATNRPEVLDPALLRPGRFDRQVLVDRPDRTGRRAILALHGKKVQLENEADLEVLAAMTAGLVGADLANIINEAALLAARRDASAVQRRDLEEAIERVVAGLEKKNRVLSPDEKRRVAHHEVGHALTAMTVPGTDAVQKISIIPRGIAALGYTLQRPHEDRFLMTKAELESKIAVLLGGRVAEELVFDDVSTGAQDDLTKATDIARAMVVYYGMSDTLGHVSMERPNGSMLGIATAAPPTYSQQTAREIDCEVRRIIDEQYERVRGLLTARRPLLMKAGAVLLEQETLSGEELAEVIANTPGRPTLVAH